MTPSDSSPDLLPPLIRAAGCQPLPPPVSFVPPSTPVGLVPPPVRHLSAFRRRLSPHSCRRLSASCRHRLSPHSRSVSCRRRLSAHLSASCRPSASCRRSVPPPPACSDSCGCSCCDISSYTPPCGDNSSPVSSGCSSSRFVVSANVEVHVNASTHHDMLDRTRVPTHPWISLCTA